MHKCNLHTCNLQHAIYNMQFATCNLQHEICNMQFATYNLQHAICNIYFTTFNLQHSICNMQLATFINKQARIYHRPYSLNLVCKLFQALKWSTVVVEPGQWLVFPALSICVQQCVVNIQQKILTPVQSNVAAIKTLSHMLISLLNTSKHDSWS